MFYLALSIFQHIGSFNTSHFDILNWLAKIDMTWVKARFNGIGGLSSSEEKKPALKFGIGENVKHTQSKSPLHLPWNNFFASSQQNLKQFDVINMVTVTLF